MYVLCLSEISLRYKAVNNNVCYVLFAPLPLFQPTELRALLQSQPQLVNAQMGA